MYLLTLIPSLFPYTTLFRSASRESLRSFGVPDEKIHMVPQAVDPTEFSPHHRSHQIFDHLKIAAGTRPVVLSVGRLDRKSTRLNSSHSSISYAVFCLKKKTN